MGVLMVMQDVQAAGDASGEHRWQEPGDWVVCPAQRSDECAAKSAQPAALQALAVQIQYVSAMQLNLSLGLQHGVSLLLIWVQAAPCALNCWCSHSAFSHDDCQQSRFCQMTVYTLPKQTSLVTTHSVPLLMSMCRQGFAYNL